MYRALLIFLLTVTSLNSIAQNTYVPDDNFEQALIDLGYDDVLDNNVLTSNISGITNLNIRSKSISDLTGIEDFSALTLLNCGINQLTNLDVSNNTALNELSCYNNKLTSLDLSTNTALTGLDCDINQLTSLDVSNNIVLTKLYCTNNQLTSLNVTGNTVLEILVCYNNRLPSLDVSNNTALNELWCGINQLTSLDVSKNTALTLLYCSDNQLTNLDVSTNNSLNSLGFGYNQLTSLDISANTALTLLACEDNQLTTLDISVNSDLEHLRCFANQLTSLDIRNGNNQNITYFDASQNIEMSCIFVDDKNASYITNWVVPQISTFVETQAECDDLPQYTYLPDDNFEQALIDLGYDNVLDDYVLTDNISGITLLNIENKSINNLFGIEDFSSLEYLDLNFNNLISLDLSSNLLLTYLSFSDNQISDINLSSMVDLTELYCTNNQLTSLDISENTALTVLGCDNNLITTLDVSLNTALLDFRCFSNRLTSLDIRNGNNENITYFDASQNQNLWCILVDDKEAAFLDNWIIYFTSKFVETEAECDALDIENSMIENINVIYPNPTSGIINFGFKMNIKKIMISDILGKLIIEKYDLKQNETIDLENFEDGIYIINIETENGIFTSKIIKR